MGLSHINLHGIHKILALSIFLYTYALSNVELSQAYTVAEGSRCGVSRVDYELYGKDPLSVGSWIKQRGGHELLLELLNVCWWEPNKSNLNDPGETQSSEWPETWALPLKAARLAHFLPGSHLHTREDSFSQEVKFPKTTRESSWGHIPRICAISSAWQDSLSVVLCFPNEVKVLLAGTPASPLPSWFVLDSAKSR